MARSRFPISLVMIVRDEEATLGRCLASIDGLVDEIVVVDTGSVDRTVEIAASYGAHVHHFSWIDDFAAARNHALAQATHPWRLVLDADEWLADREQAGAALEEIRGQVPDFVGTIEMLQLDETTGRLRDTETFPLARLLPREVTYRGRIHEQLVSGLPMRGIAVLIGHDGYTPAANARKDGRNIALLEAALTEDPDNAYYWFQLGTDHYSHQRYAEALPYLVTAYNLLHPDGAVAAPLPAPDWWHLLTVKLMLTLVMLKQFDQAVALGEQEADAWLRSSEFFYIFGAAVRGQACDLIGVDDPRADALLASAVGCWIHAVEQGDVREYSGAFVERGTVLAARALADTYDLMGRPHDAAEYRALAEARSSRAADPVAASA